MPDKTLNNGVLPSAATHFLRVLSIIFLGVLLTLPLMLYLMRIKSHFLVTYHVVEILTIPLGSAIIVWCAIVLPLRRVAIQELSARNEDLRKLESAVSILEATLESTADGIVVLDMNKRIVVYIRKYLEMWGIPRDVVESRDAYVVFDYISPLMVDPDWFLNRSTELHDNSIQDALDVIHLKDGRIFERFSHPQQINDENVGRVSSYRDVTERVRSMQALVENEANFRQLFEQADYAQIVFDCDLQTTLDLNPAAERLFRSDKPQLAQKHPSHFFSPDEYRKVQRQQLENSNCKAFRIISMKLLIGDGTEVYLSAQGSRIDLCGCPVMLCTFNDISEKLLMERQAREIEAKLIQANKMTSLGLIVTGIAHEINNPNNYILVNSEMLANAWKDINLILAEYYERNGEFSVGRLPYTTIRNEMPGMLESITEGAIRIRDIVNTLKEYAKDGKGVIRSDIDMNRVVTHVATIVSHQIARHTEHFTLDTAPGLPLVTGSMQQLEQVIINLVLNAIQALPSPDRGVSVSTHFDSRTGNVCIEVSDQGEGVPAEIADNVMEPYFTTKLDSGGTGLGLSISQAIIRAHKGSLTFTSSPGQGTKFIVQLPASPISNRGDTL